MRKLFLAAAVLLLLPLPGCGARAPEPDATFKKFFRRITRTPEIAPRLYAQLSKRSRDAFEARWKVIKDKLPQGTKLPRRAMFVAAFSKLGDRILKITVEKRSEKRASLHVVFSKGAARIVMVREENRWKVDLLSR